jgi:hypothetical protein
MLCSLFAFVHHVTKTMQRVRHMGTQTTGTEMATDTDVKPQLIDALTEHEVSIVVCCTLVNTSNS